MTDHKCETCGKSYKTRSGLWKHQKAKGHGKFANQQPLEESKSPDATVSPIPTVEPPISESDSETSGDTSTSFDWADFDFGSSEHTDTIPATLKSVVASPPPGSGKMSKAQYAALQAQNVGILKMGLSGIDALLTRYGRAVSLDDDFTVAHSEADKDLVANAQWRYLEEKGLFLTNYLSTGMIAGSLTVWYVGQPMMRIRKNAKKKLIRGRLFSRLPLIGRFFRRKEPAPEIGQNVEVEEIER